MDAFVFMTAKITINLVLSRYLEGGIPVCLLTHEGTQAVIGAPAAKVSKVPHSCPLDGDAAFRRDESSFRQLRLEIRDPAARIQLVIDAAHEPLAAEIGMQRRKDHPALGHDIGPAGQRT